MFADSNQQFRDNLKMMTDHFKDNTYQSNHRNKPRLKFNLELFEAIIQPTDKANVNGLNFILDYFMDLKNKLKNNASNPLNVHASAMPATSI